MLREMKFAGMDTKLPLSALLSQVLVAFTIELDNEFEHQMPHRTTSGTAAGSRHGPWLASLAMWSNFMQYVVEEGSPLRELAGQVRMVNVPGLERWGYITVTPDPADTRPKPPRRDWVVRPTRGGRKAQNVWRPLDGEIEQRWQARFGNDEIVKLRESLQTVRLQIGAALPHYLPVVAHEMFAVIPHLESRAPADPDGGVVSRLDLSALLSQVLLAFAIEFEQESKLSLPISANVLRVLNEKGERVGDLPRMAGVSKEAISMSTGLLEKRGYIAIEPDPASSRVKMARLIAKGLDAQAAYRRRLGVIDERWRSRFGRGDIGNLRESLECLVDEPAAQQSLLFQALEPYSEGWRATVRKPETLPHYPIVLHRGGFPDGS
jgi:DNA-binding MarR family transcriptional regulator